MKQTSTEQQALEIMRRCPRFYHCSAPSCPLDPKQDLRPVFPGEPTCRLRKAVRLELAKGANLSHGGLTVREWKVARRRERWATQPAEKREAVLKRLTIARAVLNRDRREGIPSPEAQGGMPE